MGNDITVGPKGATRTLKFLASVLNDGRDLPEDMTYNGVSKMVKTSSTMLSLKELGYKFYNVGSWFPESKALAIADRNYSYARYDLMGLMFGSELAVAVVDRSFLREIDLSPILRNANFEVRRQEHLYQRDITVTLAQSYNQTKVVMTHLLLPHLPYVWGADGGEMPTGLSEWEAYLQQAEFTGGFLVEMAKGIVEADQDAIILIQSDEGILFNVSSGSAGLTKTQANGVLTAWRIPSGNSTLSEEKLSGVAFTDILGFVRDLVTISNQAETELND